VATLKGSAGLTLESPITLKGQITLRSLLTVDEDSVHHRMSQL
jgi:hypothetical protein